ncbi:hypothetical protein FNV43_RR26960 [Rhamnella rubrinervis]|uniref:Transcription elongation factor Eaf N-terminal domain-containing protein n=1 Tax=Rhamnella rubrinervis TaxID=2594499 RepID=A0A8K0GP87_9ROSA|nr:hypothetical protein FNV43_RR26960 [Rhamnella rubrinervis]
MAGNAKEEPKTAPQSDRWYNLTLGPSFKDDSSNKYCTLRYEFKPASIDKTKPGSLRKTKENRINTLRLERLHRAVKQLRHVRQPGESAGAVSGVAVAQSGLAVEPRLSPVGKAAKPMHNVRSTIPAVPVEVERIDTGGSENQGARSSGKGIADYPSDPPNAPAPSPPEAKNGEVEEHQDIDIDEIFGTQSPEDGNTAEDKNVGFDMNVPHHNDTDDEIADVDDSGDEVDKGPNAAEALRAQVNAEERGGQTSTSSSSSGSGSSGSGSGSASSSSSDSEGSDEDSVNSI